MNNATPAKSKPSAFKLFAAAVAAFGAALSLHHAVAVRSGGRYYVEYRWFPGAPLIHTEEAPNTKQALRRYEKALGDDYASIH